MSKVEFKYEQKWKTNNPEEALLQFEKEQKSEEILLNLWKAKGLSWLITAIKHILDETPQPKNKKRLINSEIDTFSKNEDYFEFQEIVSEMGVPWISDTLHTYYPEQVKGTIFEVMYKMTLI